MKVGQPYEEQAFKKKHGKKKKWGLYLPKWNHGFHNDTKHRGMTGKLPNWPGDGPLIFLRKSLGINALMTRKPKYNISKHLIN